MSKDTNNEAMWGDKSGWGAPTAGPTPGPMPGVTPEAGEAWCAGCERTYPPFGHDYAACWREHHVRAVKVDASPAAWEIA